MTSASCATMMKSLWMDDAQGQEVFKHRLVLLTASHASQAFVKSVSQRSNLLRMSANARMTSIFLSIRKTSVKGTNFAEWGSTTMDKIIAKSALKIVLYAGFSMVIATNAKTKL